jgi:hypothetical protein
MVSTRAACAVADSKGATMKRAYATKGALAALAMGLMSLGLVTGCGSDDSSGSKADCSKCSADNKSACEEIANKCTEAADTCQALADFACDPLGSLGDGGLTTGDGG